MSRAARVLGRSPVLVPSRLLLGLSLALSACVAAPDDTAQLSLEKPLAQRSERGLVEASVALDTAELSRGRNDFLITLRAASASDDAPLLTSVEAVMAAHGHHAGAPGIVPDADGRFRVEGLDLFMSGRWQVTLGVELAADSDTVDFALDVP